MAREPDNSAPAIITNHPFTARAEWWTVCEICGLAEAAHASSAMCEACGEPVDELGALICAKCSWQEAPR